MNVARFISPTAATRSTRVVLDALKALQAELEPCR